MSLDNVLSCGKHRRGHKAQRTGLEQEALRWNRATPHGLPDFYDAFPEGCYPTVLISWSKLWLLYLSSMLPTQDPQTQAEHASDVRDEQRKVRLLL